MSLLFYAAQMRPRQQVVAANIVKVVAVVYEARVSQHVSSIFHKQTRPL